MPVSGVQRVRVRRQWEQHVYSESGGERGGLEWDVGASGGGEWDADVGGEWDVAEWHGQWEYEWGAEAGGGGGVGVLGDGGGGGADGLGVVRRRGEGPWGG